ncbi:hypothetical protein P170DRAFT_240654 [Aspergillus steynii IBT 23096]|uniref:C2H2-type domain-containing protein n=1 Tax=Aspergillus steynii IBT 23096 TaxID=1392250 RepID=A0A2I2G3G2_9EURO|nr:uncharacterized protein P170DRAFT_240654 [Aspergillus steynii IBT 23096]PLB47414.1 hypothetical protein P170DRAFT_240654 [Aspergillus steynii IBT 23096]
MMSDQLTAWGGTFETSHGDLFTESPFPLSVAAGDESELLPEYDGHQFQPELYVSTFLPTGHVPASSSADAGLVSVQMHGTEGTVRPLPHGIQPNTPAMDVFAYTTRMPTRSLPVQLNGMNVEYPRGDLAQLPTPINHGLAKIYPADVIRPSQDRQPNRNEKSHLQCEWKGCTYEKGFKRDADLWRHIKSLHLAPSYRCGFPGCSRLFNRKDKIKEHVDKAHSLLVGEWKDWVREST